MQACYEKRSNGNWNLVVYHDGVHNDLLNKIIKTAAYNVPDNMIDIDGSPNMGKIRQAYLEPRNENDG
jgi:hypothetical protein